MSFPRYERYRESGVAWLGEVPEQWPVERSRRLFAQRDERAQAIDEQLTASQKHGIVRQASFMELEGRAVVRVIHGADILKRVRCNDFVISMRSFQGGLELSALDGSISSAYVMLTPSSRVVPQFFRHLFKSKPYIQALQSTSNLVRDGQAMRYENFVQIDLPLPSKREQHAITAFLDRETAKIDALIEEQRRLIALLKEKRQAIISQAVTKGLDPTVSYQDTGVPWLPTAPHHWSVRPLKDLVSVPITDGPHETPEFLDTGVPFVSAEAVSSGSVDFSKIRGFISREDHERYSKKYLPQRGDVYMIKSGATTGATAIVETDAEFNIWSPLAAIRCNDKIIPEYMHLVMQSRAFRDGVELNWSYGTQQNIGMNVIENLSVAVPTTEEQRLILAHVAKAAGTANAESAAHSCIQLLQERRSALISAAVTGKIDVRAYAAKPVASARPYSAGFARQVLGGEILSRCNDAHMGRVKLQKLIYLTEHHAQLSEIEGEYERAMAGPLDRAMMRELPHGLKRRRWFREERQGRRVRFLPLDKQGRHARFLKVWADRRPQIDEVLRLLGSATMRDCERVATLYAAWNDLLLDGEHATEEAILREAATAEGWHASKERTAREKWVATLGWMRQKGLVPTGWGSHTHKPRTEEAYEPA